MPSVISRVARSQPAAAATFPPAPPVTDRPTSSRRTPRRPRGRTVAIVATLSLLPNRMTRSRDMTAPRLGSRRISARRRQCPRQPTFFENGRAGIGGCHAARVLVRAPGDEIGDEERQRNLERDEQRERGEQDRDRLPDGQLARVGARRGQLPRAREQRVCAKMPGGSGGSSRSPVVVQEAATSGRPPFAPGARRAARRARARAPARPPRAPRSRRPQLRRPARAAARAYRRRVAARRRPARPSRRATSPRLGRSLAPRPCRQVDDRCKERRFKALLESRWRAGCEAAWDLILACARVAEIRSRSGLQVTSSF